ncbi:hypothetical protein LZ30DRAFT_471668 [Colletotrichum cereale]|nr:hypothetical protein LZ30DRAFT_471668 [Colletotrichum cereale]
MGGDASHQAQGNRNLSFFCEIMRGANVWAPMYMFGTKGNTSRAGDAGLDGRLNGFDFHGGEGQQSRTR